MTRGIDAVQYFDPTRLLGQVRAGALGGWENSYGQNQNNP